MPEDPRDIAVSVSDLVADLMTSKDRIAMSAGVPVTLTFQPAPPAQPFDIVADADRATAAIAQLTAAKDVAKAAALASIDALRTAVEEQ